MAPAEQATLARPAAGRLRHELRRPENWWQLVRFGCVGACGYVVNLIVFGLLHGGLDADYRLAAVVAFVLAAATNFVLNRRWTFAAHDGKVHFQATRFLAVSAVAFAVQFVALTLLVSAGVDKFTAQAISIVTATPLNFLGNKLWSFGRRSAPVRRS